MKSIATTLIALVLIASTPALASDYKHAVARDQYCGAAAGLSEDAYKARERGKPKQPLVDEMKHLLDGTRTDAIVKFTIDYGYDKAVTAKDAYMTTWAFCMDNTPK